MNTLRRQSSWIGVAAALYAAAYPVMSAAADDNRFEKLSVYLERNVQDNDAEIRFDVTGPEDGLAALRVLAPGGRRVIDFRTPDSKLGIRTFALESPEPDDVRIIRADFPAGAYRFEGKTTKGANLQGEARLSHQFPPPAAFEYPRPDQQDVPVAALTLRWTVPDELGSCVVVIEQVDSPYEIRAQLPGSANAFTVPEGFLRAGQAYKFAIGTVAKDGNRSFIEAAFSTVGSR